MANSSSFSAVVIQETTPPPDLELPRVGQDHAQASIIDQLDRTPMDTRLRRIAREKVPATGRWFLEDERIQAFMYAQYYEENCLWLDGHSGSGKQTLTVTMAEALISSTSGCALGWFACSGLDHKRRKADNVLRTLAIQVARQQEELFSQLVGLVTGQHGMRAIDDDATDTDRFDYLDINHWCSFLEHCSRNFNRVYLMVTNVDGCYPKEADDVVYSLFKLADDDPGSFRILCTSTTEFAEASNLRDRYGFMNMNVTATREDLNLLLRHNSHLGFAVAQSKLDAILDRMVKYPDEGFIGAMIEMQYQLDLLRHAHEPFESSEMTPVSSSWEVLLAQRLQLTESQPHPRDMFYRRYGPVRPRHRFLFRWLIRFIHMVSRTEGMEMTPDEICGALSQGQRSPTRQYAPCNEWPAVYKVTVHEILSLCDPFIQRTPDGKTLEFSHISYYDMIMERCGLFEGSQIHLHESLGFVARFCFVELLNAARGRAQMDFKKDRNFLEERQRMHPFYTYAATH